MAPAPAVISTPAPATVLSETRKRGIVFMLAAYAFCTTLSIAIISPALPLVQEDLDTSQQAVNSSVTVSTFVSGLAPLFWAVL